MLNTGKVTVQLPIADAVEVAALLQWAHQASPLTEKKRVAFQKTEAAISQTLLNYLGEEI